MDKDSITSAQALLEIREKEEKEKQQMQQERNFDKSVSLATLDQLRRQNDLLHSQNLQLQKDSIEAKKTNKRIFIISIITAGLALATFITTIILHFLK